MERIRRAALIFLVLLPSAGLASSGSAGPEKRPYRDIHGHAYKRQTNLFRDKDKNGVINLVQNNDQGNKLIRKRNRTPKISTPAGR